MLKLAVLTGAVLGILPVPVLAQNDLRLTLEENPSNPRDIDVTLVIPRDGHLLLLHVAAGHARVMFPGKVTASPAIAAGTYDLDSLDATLPLAFGRGGQIVAVWSETPIHTEQFVRYGHWAVSDLDRRKFASYAEEATRELAVRLGAGPDVATASAGYGTLSPGYQPNSFSMQAYSPYATSEFAPTWKWLPGPARSPFNCPSGTRDVTGAGESCSATVAPTQRARPVVTPAAEPAYRPPRRPD